MGDWESGLEVVVWNRWFGVRWVGLMELGVGQVKRGHAKFPPWGGSRTEGNFS